MLIEYTGQILIAYQKEKILNYFGWGENVCDIYIPNLMLVLKT